MKIGFNARFLYAPTLRGWNCYTVNLLAELANLGVELLLYGDRAIHPDHLARLPRGSYQVRVAPPMRYFLWEQWWLPRQCREDRVDLLHCPANFGLPWCCPCPRVLTLHDAIDQVYYAPRLSWRDRLRPGSLMSAMYHWIARNRAEHIITVSQHAKGDLVRHLGLNPDKISVIPEAADPRFHAPVSPEKRAAVRRAFGLGKPYVFYVGGWERRKNVPFLVRAFAKADLPGVELVLAGGQDQQRAALQSLASELGIADRLRLLGWVAGQDLPALYAEALCFVYPSEYEGFGLQLCEAMAVGCPVLAANATCLPEVLGGAGLLFPINTPDSLSELLTSIKQPGFRGTLIEKAESRRNDFSWTNAGRSTNKLYLEITNRLCKSK